MKFLLSILSLFCFVSHSYEIFELKIAIKSSEFPVPMVHRTYPAIATLNTFPGSLNVSYTEYNAESRNSWQVTNNTGVNLTNVEIITYVDMEIEEAANTFFNETALLDSLALPNVYTLHSGYSENIGSEWMVDEPGYYGGTLNAAFKDMVLTNANNLSGREEDVAMVIKHYVPLIEAGQSIIVDSYIGNADVKGIKQEDINSGTAQYFNSIVFVPKTNNNNNTPPVIVTPPITVGFIDKPYVYDVDAVDKENDVLTYSLVSGQPGMTIDPLTGMISWVPSAEGAYPVTVAVSDGSLADSQFYVITVTKGSNVKAIPSGGLWGMLVLFILFFGLGARLMNKRYFFTTIFALFVLSFSNLLSAQNTNIDTTDPIFYEVIDALNEASVYVGEESVKWHKKNKCFGCHTHTQSLLGLETTDYKATIDKDSLQYLLDEMLKGQQTNGAIYSSHSNWSKTQTALALWALNDWPDDLETFREREKAIEYMWSDSTITADRTQRYWVASYAHGWWATNTGLTALTAEAIKKLVKNKDELSVSFNNPALMNEVISNVDQILTYFLNLSVDQNKEVRNSTVALRLIGLNSLVSLSNNSVLKKQAEDKIVELKALLLSRQLADGSWKKDETDASGDTLTTAYVGITLNKLKTGDTLLEDYDFKAVRFLLDTQNHGTTDANLFGSWKSPYFNTRLSSTSLVMSYLPVVLKNFSRSSYCDFSVDIRSKFKKAQLVWKDTGASKYAVYRSENHDKDFVKIQETTSNYVTVIDKSRNIEDIYYYKVSELDKDEKIVCTSPVVSAFIPKLPDDSDANLAPYFTSIPVTLVTSGSQYSYQLTGVDLDGDSFTYAILEAPSGSAIDSNNLLTWTDTATPKNYLFTLQIEDSKGASNIQQFIVKSNASGSNTNNPPVITSVPADKISQGSVFYYAVQANDLDGDKLIYSLSYVNSPITMIINHLTGEITWTTNTVGTYEYTVRVIDNNGGVATQTNTLTVGRGPDITSTPIISATTNEKYSYQVIATDPQNSPITYSLLKSPTGMTIDASTGLVSWTPSAIGDYEVTIQALNDLGFADMQSYTITVRNMSNQPPIISSIPAKVLEARKTYSYGIRATDPEGDYLVYELVKGPAAMKLIGTSLSWNPDAAESGLFDVEIKVTDARGASTTQSWKIDVQKPDSNAAPVFQSVPTVIARENTKYYYNVSYRDPDYDTPLTLSLITGATGMALYGNRLEWTPDSSHVGVQNVTLEVTDALGAKTQQSFVIKVFPNYNRPPYISGSPITHIGYDKNYSYRPNGYDADRDTLTYELTTTEPGIIIDSSTGQITWRTSMTEQSIPITIIVKDGRGGIATQSYTLYVTDKTDATNRPPYINSIPTVYLTYGNTYKYRTSAYDPDRDTLIYELVEAPANMSIDNTGNISWLTTEPDIGAHPIKVKVSDGNGGVATQDYVVYVESTTNTPPIIQSNPTAATLGRTYNYTVRGYDRDGDTLIYSLTEFPSGMAIDATTGKVTWEPVLGNHNVIVVVEDGRGGQATQSFVLSVATPNQTPTITSTPITNLVAGQLWQYDVEATDADGDTLEYGLKSAPSSMSIDSKTGLINWTPASTDVGRVYVQIYVVDPYNATVLQNIYLTITEPASNTEPTITSTPTTKLIVNQLWQYDVEATDIDGDIISYSLSNAPTGMVINSSSGLIEWTPSVVGQNEFDVIAMDSHGASTIQKVTLSVDTSVPTNNAPTFTSTPITNGQSGQAYQYDVDATDADGDTLTYALVTAPSSVTIDSSSGMINWTPSNSDIGSHSIEISVTDGTDTVTQSFTLTVTASVPTNNAPVITSTPTAIPVAGQVWQYDVDATDADGDTLTYSLSGQPSGMTIDSSSGLISWTAAVGTYSFNVNVSDDNGGTAAQQVNLTVIAAPNVAPVITSTPITTAKVGDAYQYDVNASDADGDILTYALVTAPSGMTIDGSTGLINWTPVLADVGSHSVEASVTDGMDSVSQSYTVTVTNTTVLPLALTIYVNPSIVADGDSVTITVTPTNVSGSLVSRRLWVDGNEVTLDSSGQATITASGIGQHNLEATVKDSDETVTETSGFFVKDPSDSTPPVVKIEQPIDGVEIEEISDLRDVFITVTDANLISWQLSIRDESIKNSQFMLLFADTAEKNNEKVGQLDPTMLENGIYALALTAMDKGGNEGSHLVYISVNGDMKLGHYSITFEDVNIPAAGIPIMVTRTYDTRKRYQNLDFGYGWSVTHNSIRISENGALGRNWTQVERGSGLNRRTCSVPNGDRYVSITTPDWETYEFKVSEGSCIGLFNPDRYFYMEFEPVDGGDSQLLINDYGLVTYNNGMVIDPGEVEPMNPDHYTLITDDGTEYLLDQEFGIKQITLPTGQTLTYNKDGVVHSEGLSVSFTRDANDRITEITQPDGEVLKYQYAASGDLIASLDAKGNTTSYQYLNGKYSHYLEEIKDPLGNRAIKNEYDANGRLVAHIDAEGNRIEMSHDVNGKSSTVKDRNGNTTIYVYDGNGNVLSETNGEGETTQRTYDADDNELSITDALGNKTEFSYDSKGNQLTETDALGNVTTMTYLGHQLATETNAEGEVVMTNTYYKGRRGSYTDAMLTSADGLGNITNFDYGCDHGALGKVTDPEGNVNSTGTSCTTGGPTVDVDGNGVRTTYTSTREGVVTAKSTEWTDANGSPTTLTTSYTLDANDNITETTYPDGTVSKSAYNAVDKLISDTDALGHITKYDYDKRGNLTKTTYADGTSSQTTYDGEGNTLTETDTAGRVTTYVYDKANRLVETKYHDGSSVKQSYYKNGWLKDSTDQLGNTSTYSYDDAGRQTEVKDALGQITKTTYDKAGRKVSATDARGNTVSYDYDGAGRLIKTTYPDNTTTSQSYYKNGWKKSSTDQLGNITSYEYDGVGRLTKVTNAQGNDTTYSYDELGNKLTQTDAEGRTTQWSYDEMGRTLSRTLPEGQQETFAYDDNGNLLSHTDFNGDTTTYQYDNMGRQTKIAYADNSTTTTTYTNDGQVNTITDKHGTTSYQYDSMGRINQITDSSGKVIAYEYDKAGNKTKVTADGTVTSHAYDKLNRLSEVTDGSGTTTYTYNNNGSRETVTYANGLTTTYQYDSLNRLIKQTAQKGAAIQSEYTYTLNANGQRKTISEYSGRTTTYTYDTLGQLLTENVTDPNNGNYSASYRYDQVGNRISSTINSVTTNYVYSDNDLLTKQGGVTYTYDDNGNTLTEKEGASTTTYEYDKRNQLTKVTEGANTTTYQYAATGLRTSKTTGATTISYLTDTLSGYGDVVAEYSNGTKQKTYTYGDDLISQSYTGQTFYYGYDGLGSTRMLFDASAVLTDEYNYDAFGGLLNQTGSTDNTFLFAGEQYDPSLDQYYLRARYYNQEIGRFTQMDTFMGVNSDPRTLHKYLYTANDPVNLIDPSGHFFGGVASIGVSLNLGGVLRGMSMQGARSIFTKVLTQLARALGPQAVKREVKQCIRTKGKKCKLMVPLLIIGGDAPTAADHAWDAAIGSGSNLVPAGFWFTYKKKGNSGRNFYNKQMECSKSKRRAYLIKNGQAGDCDEYPFHKTTKGGKDYYPVFVSLRLINKQDNSKAGGHFGGLVTSARLNAGGRGRDFMVVPINEGWVPTIGLPIKKY